IAVKTRTVGTSGLIGTTPFGSLLAFRTSVVEGNRVTSPAALTGAYPRRSTLPSLSKTAPAGRDERAPVEGLRAAAVAAALLEDPTRGIPYRIGNRHAPRQPRVVERDHPGACRGVLDRPQAQDER